MSAPEIRAGFRGRRGTFDLDVAFAVPGTGVTALFGPSGCGKTTILRCMAGLERMADGYLNVGDAVWQDGKQFLPVHKRRIGYVFQEASLFAHLSVRDNLLFGRRRVKPANGGLAIDEVAELLGLSTLLDRSPVRLSGGERQRVAIGRAILSDPEILLMDEPLAALDRFAKEDILPYLERLTGELAIPVVLVTHDLSEVERLADHMVLMERGRVLANGPLGELLADPALPLAKMPEAAVVVTGKVAGYDADYHLTTLSVKGAELIVPGEIGDLGAARRLRIAASDVALCHTRAPGGSSILNGPRVAIKATESANRHQVTVFLRFGEDGSGAPLLARITRKSWEALDFQVGQTVHALIKSMALAGDR